ncbi:CbiX/SirB N-terminal domain-containing protein [Frankia sp. AiPs1]|uniref:sirohydrochlorin chelatase n=1 Tax=Frankia sp. AiPs1 TaxID=573493 RepID=UPI00204339CE|nr:CbiX/SirB N-terminal domain-containing protein [Frankia sp. AiPs1]MCM3925645.1 CbiX/SirB N-terminal domain-containing protein [Frankia sp. AiPs1]
MRGLLVIGHGSRRDEANATVRELARRLATEPRPDDDGCAGRPLHSADPTDRSGPSSPAGPRPWGAVEAAFLEVSRPNIGEGYANLAAAGCTEIVVYPFFLFGGNHTRRDLPAALDEARGQHPTTRWILSEPLGLHACVVEAVRARLDDTLRELVDAARHPTG